MDTIMKKIFNLLAIGVALALAASCDISEYNPNAYGLAMTYANEANIQAVMNNFYGTFPKVGTAYSREPGKADYVTADGLDNRFHPGYDATTAGIWGDYDDIREINYFLLQLNSSACGVTGAVKDNFEAQGRFFRAYKYFGILQSYGDLPYYDKVLGLMDEALEYKDRDSRDLVVKNMLDDLDYAIEHITATSPDATCVTKDVVLFLKMRVALYEASFRKYNNVTASVKGVAFSNYTPESLYKIAADAARQIMDTGKYKLVDDYRSLFISNNLQLDEVILGAQTSASIKGSQNNYFNYSTGNHFGLTRVFVNTFLMKDGTPYTNKAGFDSETFAQEFTNRDPRLAKIIRTPGYKFDKKTVVPDFTISPTGYQIIKFVLDTYANAADLDQTGNANLNSTPIYRYAEVLLSYAEAKAELGEMTNEIWTETVGAIRKRAGITGSSLTAVPTTVDNYLKTNFFPNVDNAAILEIRRERACELCLEGVRLFDLMRWGAGKCLTNAWNGINIVADTPMDFDNDGKNDYYFSENAAPAGFDPEVSGTFIQLNKGVVSAEKVSGNQYKVTYDTKTARYWAADGHLCLCAIGQDYITQYKNKGYTLTQNPGY